MTLKTYFLKTKINPSHSFFSVKYKSFDILQEYILLQNLFVRTKMVDLVTLAFEIY
jgi:hypothetical protein